MDKLGSLEKVLKIYIFSHYLPLEMGLVLQLKKKKKIPSPKDALCKI